MSHVTDSIRHAMTIAGQGRIGDAISSLRSLLTSHGNDAEVHHSLGLLQFQTGALEQAVFHFDKARRLDTTRADMLSDYGTALNVTGKPDEAVNAFRKAVEIDPRCFPAQLGLASALIGLLDFDGAVEAARAACALAPNRPEPWVNLGLALIRSGRSADAVKSLREALAIMPDQPLLFSNLCSALTTRPELSPEELFREHERLGQVLRSAYGGGIRSFGNDASPDRMLRIGYLSNDFKEGATAQLLGAVLASHDRERCRPFCYSTSGISDDATHRLRTSVWDWKDVSRFNEGGVAQAITADRIDILVELNGHTPGARTGALAIRAAPVQVSWFGYPCSTGLRAIGHRLVDSITDPEGAEALSTEKLIRLDGCFVCFQPSAHAPEVSPGSTDGPITFGCSTDVAFISEPVIETWAAILRGLSGSRLELRTTSFADVNTARRLHELFTGMGVGADRARCLPLDPSPAGHLAHYAGIDIALDTFPRSGAAAACEALDMGVPVITLTGQAHGSRLATSILTSVGMDSLAARSTEDYIRLATELAQDRKRLASLRTGTRALLRNSPLCDGPGFTRKLESAYRDIWRAWCSNLMYS